jgi:hypothetical protein
VTVPGIPPPQGATGPSGPGPHCWGFTITHITLGKAPLDDWSDRCSDLYLTIHNTHKRQTSMLPAGFEPPSPGIRAASDPRVRPRGHWDRCYLVIRVINTKYHEKDILSVKCSYNSRGAVACRYMALSYTVPNTLHLTCKFFLTKPFLYDIFASYVLCPFEFNVFCQNELSYETSYEGIAAWLLTEARVCLGGEKVRQEQTKHYPLSRIMT